MAGVIELSPNVSWSAAGWLFRSVLEYLQVSVRDAATAAKLEEIVRVNLPSLRVQELSGSGRAEVFDAICGSLVDHFDRELRADLPNRDSILTHLQELVAVTCGRDRIEMWLCATSDVVPTNVAREDLHRNDLLIDEVGNHLPRIWLGETEVEVPGSRRWRGPVGRLFDLLYSRRATRGWTLPTLDSTLETELLSAFAIQPTDPSFSTTDSSSLAQFLAQNRGRQLFISHRLSRNGNNQP